MVTFLHHHYWLVFHVLVNYTVPYLVAMAYHHHGGCSLWCRQFRVLLWKNWILAKRNWPVTTLQLALPIVMILVLLILEKSAINGADPVIRVPPSVTIPPLRPCTRGARESLTSHCFTFVYGPTGQQADAIVQLMANHDGLTVSSNVNSTQANVIGFSTGDAVTTWIAQNPNRTHAGIKFLATLGSTISYNILYNATDAAGLLYLSSMFQALDTAILHYNLNQSSAPAAIEVGIKAFPRLPSATIARDVYTTAGGVLLFVPLMFQFMLFLYQVSHERELKLDLGLRANGMKAHVFWVSFAVSHLILSLLTVLILLVFGYICQFDFFLRSNFGVNLIIYLAFSWSLIPLAYVCSVCVSSTNMATVIGFLFFVVGIFIQIVFAGDKVYFWYDSEHTSQVPQYILSILLTPFAFVKCYADSLTLTNPLQAATLTFNSFTQPFDVSTNQIVYHSIQPTAVSVGMMLLSLVFYLLFGLYLDEVCSRDGFTSRSVCFCLKPSTYGCGRRHPSRNSLQLSVNKSEPSTSSSTTSESIPSYPASTTSDSTSENHLLVKHETSYGTETEGQSAAGLKSADRSIVETVEDIQGHYDNLCQRSGSNSLRLHHLTKVYQSSAARRCLYSCCCCGCSRSSTAAAGAAGAAGRCTGCCPAPTDFVAASDLCLCVPTGSLLALLGHNGAGKTTTINMLTGLLQPTSGTAYLYEHELSEDLNEWRQLLGVCPQYDVLWNELTPEEHLRVYATVKGVAADELTQEVDLSLEKVGLLKNSDRPSTQYSGGQRRRLSVACCSIGKTTKVLFLDEPTTGMDIDSRQDVWRLIFELKQTHIIVMTTHSMTEADSLADEIAIMKAGRFKCIGTPLQLKRAYGRGHVLTLEPQRNCADELRSLVLHALSAERVTEAGSSAATLTFVIPFESNMTTLVKLIHRLEYKSASLVRNITMHFSSMEDVFMKVTEEQS